MVINIKGYDVLIDDDIAPLILARKWHICDRKRGIYFATSVLFPDGKWRDVKLHRFIMECPPGLLIDHKDGNHLDCRRQNLRIATTVQNTRNEPMQAGFLPFAMLYRDQTGYRDPAWIKFSWPWSRPAAMSAKYRSIK
jgi:hypothetical protein